MMDTYLKNEFITIHYHVEQKIIRLTWLGFVDSAALRQGLDSALNLAKNKKTTLMDYGSAPQASIESRRR